MEETLSTDEQRKLGSTSREDPPQKQTPQRTHVRDSLIGRTLADRYEVLEQIGRGGMGEIYLARHKLLNKEVAIKVLREDLVDREEAMVRFQREAMAAAKIGDPHIVDITDFGFTDQGEAFIAMERLEGRDLRSAISEDGALAQDRAVKITRQILKALSAAHREGIVHRDLKSENIFLTPREEREFVKLLDFGISKILRPLDGAEETGLTSTGVVMGTPQYLSPEQAQGEDNVDHRSDIYAVGVILYEMLTGQLPFQGKSVVAMLLMHVNDAPQPPRERRPDMDIAPGLEAVVLRALSKRPDDRYASADDMLAALVEFSTLPGDTQSPISPVSPVPRTGRAAWLVGLGAVLVVTSALMLWRHDDPPTRVASPDAGPATDVETISRLAPDASSRSDLALAAAPTRDSADTVRRLTVLVKPPAARVYIGTRLVGAGRVALPVSARSRQVKIKAAGHLPRSLRLRPWQTGTIRIQLRKLPASSEKLKDLPSNPYRKK